MKTSSLSSLGLALFLAAAMTTIAQDELPPLPANAVTPVVPAAVQPFDLADVRLAPSPFRDAMERDRAYLLRLSPDRFLHTFRLNVGLPSDAEPYGGWESPDVELRGHSAGHYLSACALMYRSTGDTAFKERVDAMVAGFAACQAASPEAGFNPGYLSAFPESFIDRVERDDWVWAPWYTLHKIMAGLLDAHRLAGNAQALTVAEHMADWIAIRVDGLTREQMQASIDMEFGGMNDVLAQLYALTGNPLHLRLAQAFDHDAVFDPLAAGEDPLTGLHANTQIPKVIGAVREYTLTGEDRYDTIARNFWNDVALHRSFVIGGNSDREHFFPLDDFAAHLSSETAETCNTHNMLKLTRDLFALEPDARTMDFYERGLYNHILGSQDPARGMFTYLTPLASGYAKVYSTPETAFWCCVGTGMENHAKYGDTIFSHTADALYVNLFIPATLTWDDQGVTVTQSTTYPESGQTTLTIEGAAAATFALRIRHPGWAEGQLTASINGGPATALDSTPGSYATLQRTWQPGDTVTLTIPLALRSEPLPGDDRHVAVLYGPVALATRLGTEDLRSPYVTTQTHPVRFPAPEGPALVTTAPDWLHQIKKVGDAPLLFRTEGLARPRDITLEPFNAVHQERMAVYFPRYTPDEWEQHLATLDAVENEIATARDQAVDRVDVGNLTSERAHDMVLEEGTFDTGAIAGQTWRQCQRGAAFGYSLQTGGHDNLELVYVIGARDSHRSFDVWIDDTKLETPSPDGSAPGLVRVYRLPLLPEHLRGKTAATIRFVPRDEWGATSPNVFEVMLVPSRDTQLPASPAP